MLQATLTSIGRATGVDIALLLGANDTRHCNTGAELSNPTLTQADPVCEVNFLLAGLTCRTVINSSSHKNSGFLDEAYTENMLIHYFVVSNSKHTLVV